MRLKKFLECLSLCLAVAITAPAQADSEALLRLIDALEKNGTLDAATAKTLKSVAMSENEQAADAATTATTATTATSATASSKGNGYVEFKDGKLALKSDDGNFELKINGRLMADYAYYNAEEDEAGNDIVPRGHGAEIRRARIGLSGKLWKHWKWKTEYDFTGEKNAHLRDAYLQWNGLSDTSITIGHHKMPFSMQQQTSSKSQHFLERSMVDALTTGRDYGVSLAYQQERWRLRFGLFTEMDQDGEGATDRDSAWSFAGRLNVTPMKEKTQVVHLGGGFVYESAEDESSVRFRARPDSHVSDTRLIDTNSHGYDSILRYGLELGVMRGPFTAMAEWIKAKVDRYDWVNEADVADFDANGYYIQVGYILTGESRGYTNGAWKNPKPNSIVGQGGHGAWELALRWSNLDLNDNDVDGGEEDNLSVGLNWYLTPTILMRADYTTVLEVDGGKKDGVEPSIFQVRTQYEF